MLLGKVTGTVVASAKDERLENFKLLVVENISPEAEASGGYVVAVDAVGAGVGDVVLYASGSSARQTILTDKRPADAAVIAIVDAIDIGAKTTYKK